MQSFTSMENGEEEVPKRNKTGKGVVHTNVLLLHKER